jgi:hypothetical protein
MKVLLITIGIITGSVVDSETKEPLTGVKVETITENNITYTDFDGIYNIESKSDSVKLKISYISYQDTIISVGDMKDGLIELKSY